jgi:hypothetical protein
MEVIKVELLVVMKVATLESLMKPRWLHKLQVTLFVSSNCAIS